MKFQRYQAQRLTISVPQQQSLEVLAMNERELAVFLAKERQGNPLLRVDLEDSGPGEAAPEITVRQGEKGPEAAATDRWSGRLGISEDWQTRLAEAETPEQKAALEEKLRRARWLAAAVDQRRRTITALAETLLLLQGEFFTGGELKGITLQQAADRMGVHSSTVSRALNGKRLQCARGTYPLRFFFSAGVPLRQKGEDITITLSRNSVKDRILRLIREEDPRRPLSDDDLRKLLYREGLELSRRTVTKYRQECGVPSSSRRKREKGKEAGQTGNMAMPTYGKINY